MVRFVGKISIVVLVLMLAACGSSADSGSGSGGVGGAGGTNAGPALDDSVNMLAKAYCGWMSKCQGPLFELMFNTEAQCATNFEANLVDGPVARFKLSIDAGRLIYDGSKISACITAFESASCGTNFEDLPACDAVFVGQVADGGDCISNEDCAGGAFCSANEQTCPGKCAARNARGQACTKDSCTKGLYCGEGDTCTDKELDGGACTDDEHCLSGDCEQDSEDSPGNGPDEKGVCVKAGMMPPTIKLGEPCSLEMTSVCEAGAACVMTGLDPSTSEPITLCKAKVAVDETCYLGFPHCPSGYYCDAKPQDGGSFEGACQALPKDGEACLTESFGTCAPGLVCDQGTCRKVARIGEACTSNATCISGLCESGACVVAPCDP